jgi:hypothetical protein
MVLMSWGSPVHFAQLSFMVSSQRKRELPGWAWAT